MNLAQVKLALSAATCLLVSYHLWLSNAMVTACTKLRDQMEAQAAKYGKRIRLVRFVYAEVLWETVSGK